MATVRKKLGTHVTTLSVILVACSGSALAIGNSLSDENICDAVENCILFDKAVPYNRVDVACTDGITTLTGTTNNILAKQRAVRLAETTKGVRAVVNRITVKPTEVRSSAEIKRDVEAALLADPATDSYEVSTKVDEQGHVTLSGSVDSWQEKKLTEKVAMGVRGVTEVTNDVAVDYKTDRPDYEIKPEIEKALEWNALVDHALIDVEVDDKANALVVLGGQVVFDFVENALVNIDTPANAASPPGFLMVPLKTADATEVAQSITRLWNQKTMPPGELPPQAEANRLLNVLIVRGTQDQIDEIRRDIIDPLDSYTPPALLAETITLKYAQAEEVADAISRVFEDTREAYRTMAGGGGKQPPALEMTVAITPDAATNQVIVQASETNMGKIKARIAELDREDIASRSATSTKVYTLDTADPNAVVNMIREWTRTQQQRAGRNQTPTARDTIVAVAEPTTQSVVVTASEMNHRLIQDVIDGLDNETVAARERQRHVMPLRFAAAGEVANQLTQVFRNVTRRRGDTGPAFVADTIGNTVVVSVNAEEYAEVEQLVTALDQEPGIDTQRITKVYPLIYADPASVNTVVVNMFRSTGRAQTGPLDQVASSPETATRAVVVTASTKNQEAVAAMIEALDKESTFTKVMHTYQLQKANAEEVATALQEVYRARRSNIRGDTPVQITPEAATNSLLILANQTEMDELSGLIKSLDVEPMAERQRQVRSFPLADADPWSVQEAINKLFRGSGRNERDQVTAVAEWGSQSVIVSASPENMVRIEELVAQFDVEGAAEQAVHVIALESTDAESVSQTLNEIFVKSAPRQQGNQEVPISIAALRGSKAVVVKCKDDDFTRIQAAVAELDREDAVIGEEVRVVTLLYSNAEEVKTAVQEYLRKPGGSAGRGTAELAGDVRLAVLDQTNAVVVSGDLTRVEHIEKLITEMRHRGREGLDSADHCSAIPERRAGSAQPRRDVRGTSGRRTLGAAAAGDCGEREPQCPGCPRQSYGCASD